MKDKMEMNFLETFVDIPNRVVSLLWNLLSRWGVALGTTFFLIWKNVVNNWYAAFVWIIFLLFFLFKTEAPEIIDKIVRIREQK